MPPPAARRRVGTSKRVLGSRGSGPQGVDAESGSVRRYAARSRSRPGTQDDLPPSRCHDFETLASDTG